MAKRAQTAPGGRRPGEGKLWIVGTPLGNRGDLSPRAREVLAAADAILCEDTRVTARLFGPGDIHGPLERADAHALATTIPALIARLQAGVWLALVSDAGMPVISDPGAALIDAALSAGIDVEVVPGPCAVSCALAASGLSCGRYFFQGFLARKGRARSEQLGGLAGLSAAVVIYESPHRVQKTLADLAELVGNRRVALCRELTKRHEEVLRGSCAELIEMLAQREADGSKLKGECVIVVEAPGSRPHESRRSERSSPASAPWRSDAAAEPLAGLAPRCGGSQSFEDARGKEPATEAEAALERDLNALARECLAQGMAPSQAAKALVSCTGITRSQAYAAVLNAQSAHE